MQIMKRLLIKNKRKLWLWFLLLVFLFLACRAAYITGSKAEQTRNNEVEEPQGRSRRSTALKTTPAHSSGLSEPSSSLS